MQIKQIIRNIVASLMIVVVFLTGCNGQNILDVVFPVENTDLGQNGAHEDIQQTESDSVPTPTVGPSLSNNILIWLPPQFDPDAETEAGKLMRAQITLFQEQYPDYEIDIRVKAENGPSSVFNSLLVTSSVAQPALPSIVLIPQANLESAVEQGVIQPLQGLSPAYDENDWYPIAGEMSKYHDVEYSLPLASDAIGLVLQSNKIGGEYISLVDANSVLDSIAFAAGNPDSLVPMIYYQSIGGKFVDDLGQITIDEQKLNELLSAIERYRKSSLFPAAILGFQSEEQLWNAFASNEENNVITWTSYPLAESADYFISPLPGIGDQAFTFARGWVWCLVDQKINTIQPSIIFMEHMTDPIFLSEWTPKTVYFPVRPSSIIGWDESQRVSIQAIMQSAELLPSESVLSTIKSAMIKAVQDVLQGVSTPEVAAQKMMEKLTEAQIE